MSRPFYSALEGLKRIANPQPVPPQDYLGLPWRMSRDGWLLGSHKGPERGSFDVARPPYEGLPPMAAILRLKFAQKAANAHHRAITCLQDAVPYLLAVRALAVSAPAANVSAEELIRRIDELMMEVL